MHIVLFRGLKMFRNVECLILIFIWLLVFVDGYMTDEVKTWTEISLLNIHEDIKKLYPSSFPDLKTFTAEVPYISKYETDIII